MLPQCVRLQPDEMLSSWLAAMKDMNGMDDREFVKMMAGKKERLNIGTSSYPAGIEMLYPGIRRYGRTGADIPDLIRDNTTFFVDLPFLKAGEQAQVLETILRCCGPRTLSQKMRQEGYMPQACPACAKEDRKRCGRAYIHVPHQVPGVKACYRHGCRLVPADTLPSRPEPEKTDGIEKRIAFFFYGLYIDPVFADESICRLVMKDMMTKEGKDFKEVLAGHAELIQCRGSEQDWVFLSAASKHRFLAVLSGCRASAFRDAARAAGTEGYADALEEISAAYDLLSPYGTVMRLRCRQCGAEFYTHPAMVRLGAGCPECDRRLSGMEILDRYVRAHGDGGYELKETAAQAARIIHRPCGTEIKSNLSSFIFRQARGCPVCGKKSHVGESSMNRDGRRMTITEYRNKSDVDMAFDDGTTASHQTYDSFLRGTIVQQEKPRRTRVLDRTARLGETAVASNGQQMTIIRYRSSKDIDIAFEDGTIVCGVRYQQFKKGRVRHPYGLEESAGQTEDGNNHVGEKAAASNGQQMTIIRFRSNSDIDVQFEDGTIVKGRSYSSFRKGQIGNPNAIRHQKEREGETRTNRHGETATIVRYGSWNDIDLKFGSGEVVKNVSYYKFQQGRIKDPARERRELEEKWLGKTKKARNGMKMKVVACRKYDDVDIRFEDGTVVTNVSLKHFQDRSIKHPGLPQIMVSRIGETSVANNGQKMTIIAYRGAEDIDIRFEDGTIVEHRAYDNFKNGGIKHPDIPKRKKVPVPCTDRTGETGTASDGSRIEIIAFRGYEDIDIRFEDGTVLEHRQYTQFKNGEIRNPGAPHGLSKVHARVGETRVMNNGTTAKITAYRNNKDCDVLFVESGIVREHMCYANFVRGELSDGMGPTVKAKKKGPGRPKKRTK